MPSPRCLRVACVALAVLGASETRPRAAGPLPVPTTMSAPGATFAPDLPGETAAPAAAEAAPTDGATPAAVETAVDVVLPCGLRVLAARDLSLPVAAVVLTVEVGSEDDPPEFPGLVHALAYHLHQGNRELRPGETIAASQDAGGLHLLATGPGQVRFESLAPISRLGEVLRAESQRLRFPTVDRGRWEISLGWAASDVRPTSRLRREHHATLHGAPGLGHDGRVVGKALSGMVLGTISAQMASKFTYARSTLIVVAPEDPEAIVAQVRELFADLPPSARNVPTRPPPPARPRLDAAPPPAAPGNPPAPAGKSAARGDAPASLLATTFLAAADTASLTPAPKPTSAPTTSPAPEPAAAAGTPPAAPAAAGSPRIHTFAWPVPATTAAGLWAGALCRAINRQKREPDEPRKARLLCDYEPDPRRGVLLLRPTGVEDPVAFVRARLARLAGADAALLAAQTAFVAQALRLYVRTPLGLARQLAASAASPNDPAPGDSPLARPLDEITGLAGLTDRPALALAVEDALALTAAEARP